MKMNSNSATPLYIQLAEYLSDEIKQGKYLVGEKLPSEADLCKTFDISRITVRQALNLLAQKDLIFSVQGKGIFVKPKSINQRLNEIVSFSSVLDEKGLKGHTDVFSYSESVKNKEASDLLGDKVASLNLIGYAEDMPIVYYQSFFRPEIGEKMHEAAKKMLESRTAFSTYDLYGRIDLKISNIDQTIYAINASPELCKVMNLSKDKAVMLLKTIYYDKEHNPIEYKLGYYHSDVFSFQAQRQI